MLVGMADAAVSRSSHSIITVGLQANKNGWVTLATESGFVHGSDKKGKKNNLGPSLFLSVRGKKVFLNGKELAPGITSLHASELHDPLVRINGRLYAGPIGLHLNQQKLRILARTYEPGTIYADVFKKEEKDTITSYAPPAHSYKVRVLLHEASHDQPRTVWTLSSDHGFTIINPELPDQKWRHPEAQLNISTVYDGLYVDGASCCHERLYIMPHDGFASVNQDVYHGAFMIIHEKNRNLLINHVDLEEYVCGVLRTESWPGWPLEVNKVFAVASRSYVMAMIKTSRKQKLPYHVKNTKEHQTYRGMHNCLISRAATEQTRGIYLSYNNEPALAMFDCCCGGIIPAHTGNFNFAGAPYLARPYACTHCKRCRIYSWKTELELATLNKRLGLPNVIKDVKIASKDKAGLVRDLSIKHGNTTITMPSKQFYSALKDVKSFYFSMQKKSGKLILNGRGYGHHMGLCQWGAREMVRDGWLYKDILQFYYPGIQFMRLSA